MPAPERRTRADITVAVVLAAVVLMVAGALWWASDARHTTLNTAATADEQIDGQLAQQRLPTFLTEAWRAPSPVTPIPLVRDFTVVTGGAMGEVAGRDLVSGDVRWSYQRHRALCTVSSAFDHVVAVYRRGETCSEVTSLEWADGARAAQRNGPVEAASRVLADGSQAAVTGQRYLEVWRTDLVRTLAYGRLPTPAQPDTQPRPECAYGSLALHAERLAVVERCPSEDTARLTVQRARPEEPQRPEVDFSVLLPGEQAQVVALEPELVAVAVPGPARLLVFDAVGQQVAEHPLDIPDADLREDPAGRLAMTTRTPIGLSWFTGSAAVALDGHDLKPRWTRAGALGSGAMVDGQLVLPTPGAVTMVAVPTGEQIGELPVDRGDYSGPVGIAGSGGAILEQRGDTLVVLR